MAPRSILVDGVEYDLVRKYSDVATAKLTTRDPPGLRRFDDRGFKELDEFKYIPLPECKKRIRLLELKSAIGPESEIVCELIEADYGNSFHIPTRLANNDETSVRTVDQTSTPSSTNSAPTLLTGSSRAAKDAEGLNEEGRRVEKLVQEFKAVKAVQIKYDALSWCWGNVEENYGITIIQKPHPGSHEQRAYKKRVRRELALALKYLRRPDKARTLWIDAICIDQADARERNSQVQMMSRIYTRASEVCVWLGEHTEHSRLAIEFIRDDIMDLNNFDAICSSKVYNAKWQALMRLMQEDWFSRRWVVQELSLASNATIYCGQDSIPWKDFAVAVELFVEVETATHRLSEIMQKDEKFRHVPGQFDYVSELGASLLVHATGKVFRVRSPLQDGPGEIDTEEDFRAVMKEVFTIDPLERKSLLSLEYLVTTLFIFQTSEPRDVIYSLLGIARDAAPFANSSIQDRDKGTLAMMLCNSFLEEKPFVVDYRRAYSDVCRDFVQFVILRKAKIDPVQALDILCRPWALPAPQTKSSRLVSEDPEPKRIMPKREEWFKKSYETNERERDNRTTNAYWAEVMEKTAWDPIPGNEQSKEWRIPDPKGWEELKIRLPPRKKVNKTEAGTAHAETTPRSTTGNAVALDAQVAKQNDEQDVELPSWVADVSRAPFRLYQHPGMHIFKTGRANADALVGQPADGHRNYNAAQTRAVDLKALKFRKRPSLGHYSFYVQGFVVDEVAEVSDASQGGNIPRSWLDMVGWEPPYKNDPPDELWRTLVADRGRDNRNPPYYYARACKESVQRGGIAAGRVDTGALIDNERNSVIAQFCRRVHSVIWNRRLFRTKEGKKLGLASNVEKGDLVCIIFGCTVPVILSRFQKKEGDVDKEILEDKVEALRAFVQRCEQQRQRRANIPTKDDWRARWGDDFERKWKEMMEHKRIAERKLKRLARADQAKADSLKRLETEKADDTSDSWSVGNGHAEEVDLVEATTGASRSAEDGDLAREDYQNSAQHEASVREEQALDTHDDAHDDHLQHSATRSDAESMSGNPSATAPIVGSPVPTAEDSRVVVEDHGQSDGGGPDENTPSIDTSTKENVENSDDLKSSDGNSDRGSHPTRTSKSGKDFTTPKFDKDITEADTLFYKFKGECYLHGMMDGEALREKFYREKKDKTFELR